MTEMYGTIVSVLLGEKDESEDKFPTQMHLITNEDKIEDINWKEVYEKTEKIHEKMKKWAAKHGV